MSITPTDKPPDRDERTNGARSRRSGSLRARVAAVLRSLVDRLRRDESDDLPTVVEPSGTDDGDDSSPEALERPATQAADLEGFPSRERPLTYPGREITGINSPDVVSVETEDGLRVSVPENPDATIVSDVWTTVDP